MVDVSNQIVIERTVSAVWAYAANPDNAPAWYTNIKSVEWRTEPRLSIGARLAFVAHFLGRRMAYVYEVVEMVPAVRLVMRTADGPFPMETTYTFESAGADRTQMTLRNRGEPTGFSKWVAPFMSLAIARANRKDLALLKKLLEQP
jgi:uncharacterized membrane protein